MIRVTIQWTHADPTDREDRYLGDPMFGEKENAVDPVVGRTNGVRFLCLTCNEARVYIPLKKSVAGNRCCDACGKPFTKLKKRTQLDVSQHSTVR